MAPTQINNRDWIFQILTAPATWTEIGELTEFTHNPGENEETADTTVFSDQGQYRQQIMQRGATLEITGKYGVTTAPARDPGQALVDTLGTKVGDESEGTIQFRHTTDTNWTEWDVTCTPGEQGGGTNEKTSWGATFTRCGAARVVAVI
ncbi:MAG: hypothetical protein L0H84_05610 [Pseudonocardia sp.]|nr:hypothetical protein [Pseudonocardia sp.]